MVRVHDLDKTDSQVLEFHTSRVRGLQWNHELPWLLISGADDNRIAMWNVSTSKIIYEVHEPCLALTSFASHPTKPFTLFSSHFDASIKQWSLLGLPDIGLSMLKSLLNLNPKDILTSD
jgi:WD40 repeat protein